MRNAEINRIALDIRLSVFAFYYIACLLYTSYSLTASISGDTLYAGAKGTVNGNNYTGTGSVTFNGEAAITADYSFDSTNGNGTYNLKVTTDDNESFEVRLNVAMDGNNGTFDITIASNGAEMLSIKADSLSLIHI